MINLIKTLTGELSKWRLGEQLLQLDYEFRHLWLGVSGKEEANTNVSSDASCKRAAAKTSVVAGLPRLEFRFGLGDNSSSAEADNCASADDYSKGKNSFHYCRKMKSIIFRALDKMY